MTTEYWDKIPKQKLLRGNKHGKMGDCWRCCIAAVIGKSAARVPHFVELYRQGKLKSVSADTQHWLNDHGFALVSIQYGGMAFCPQWAGDDRAHVPMIECGPTIRSRKAEVSENHCVITIGGKLVYDPHPSGAGLLATVERYLIVSIPTYLRPRQCPPRSGQPGQASRL